VQSEPQNTECAVIKGESSSLIKAMFFCLLSTTDPVAIYRHLH